MIEKQCPKCKEWINKQATVCPRCQSKQPASAGATVIAVIIVGGLCLWGYRSCSSVVDSPEAREAAAKRSTYGDKVGAFTMAATFVEKRLKAPGTADYGWQAPSECVTDLGEGRYLVKGWVDAQNSFGAKLRTHFTCTVKYEANDKWRCESLDMDEP
jgi:hypothetical protein